MFTISESWLDASVSDLEIEVPVYNIYKVDRSNKTGGGICAYVLNTYRTEPRENERTERDVICHVHESYF